MIELILFSFFAGVLTILAPCILPVIPIIIGGTTMRTNRDDASSWSIRRPLIIITSLICSIALFTLLLKATTALLGIPSAVWSIISGVIIILLGINALYPSLWESLAVRLKLNLTANKNMSIAQSKSGTKRDILLGAALGPVFNSCSPTYALIVAVLLPLSFASGIVYLIAYCLGLGSVLLIVSIFGQEVIRKIRWMSNPSGAFQKSLGVMFIIVGIVIALGIDKQIQASILDSGLYTPIENLEKSFRNR